VVSAMLLRIFFSRELLRIASPVLQFTHHAWTRGGGSKRQAYRRTVYICPRVV